MDSSRDVNMESTAHSPTISRRSSVAHTDHASVSHSTVSIDSVEMRKARVNSDLISAFKSTCLPGADPYITGVGFYTHIKSPRRVHMSVQEEKFPSRPRFLAVRWPAGSENSCSRLPENVRELWEDLRDVINGEEQAIGKIELELEQLTQRYGGLPVPESSMFPVRPGREDTAMQCDEQFQQDAAIAEGATELQSTSRRTSIDVAAAHFSENDEDVIMQGMEEEISSRLPSGTQLYRPNPRSQRQ